VLFRSRCEIHWRASEFRELRSHRFQTVFGIGLSLWASQMRSEDKPGAALAGKCNRRQRFPNPGIVGDARAFERNVEVDAHEDALTSQFQVPNR